MQDVRSILKENKLLPPCFNIHKLQCGCFKVSKAERSTCCLCDRAFTNTRCHDAVLRCVKRVICSELREHVKDIVLIPEAPLPQDNPCHKRKRPRYIDLLVVYNRGDSVCLVAFEVDGKSHAGKKQGCMDENKKNALLRRGVPLCRVPFELGWRANNSKQAKVVAKEVVKSIP